MRINAIALPTLLLLGVLGVLVAAGAAQQGDTVLAKVNRKFQVKLPENPSTGFRWEADLDREILALQSRTYTPAPHARGVVGAGGIAVFSFLPLKKGRTTIVMRYQRPWEKEPVRKMSIHVTITD